MPYEQGKYGHNKTKKTYQDDKWKLQDPLSPYSNSGDHQFIPLKFRQEMNTSPKIEYGAMEGALSLVSKLPTSDKSESIEN